MSIFVFFFFNDTATTEIYTLPLHDALPIFLAAAATMATMWRVTVPPSPPDAPKVIGALLNWAFGAAGAAGLDRKSTRLNSSHANISYAVFCLKKKKNN